MICLFAGIPCSHGMRGTQLLQNIFFLPFLLSPRALQVLKEHQVTQCSCWKKILQSVSVPSRVKSLFKHSKLQIFQYFLPSIHSCSHQWCHCGCCGRAAAGISPGSSEVGMSSLWEMWVSMRKRKFHCSQPGQRGPGSRHLCRALGVQAGAGWVL